MKPEFLILKNDEAVFQKGIPICQFKIDSEEAFLEERKPVNEEISEVFLEEKIAAHNEEAVEIKNRESENKESEDNYKILLSNIGSSLKKVTSIKQFNIDEVLDTITQISLEITEKVLGYSLENTDFYNDIHSKIKKQIINIEKQYNLIIKVNPKYSDKLSSDLLSNDYLINSTQYKIVADSTLDRSDSIIEWEDGKIEDIAQQRLNSIKCLIKEYLNK